MSLLKEFHECFSSKNLYHKRCLFCNERRFSQLAHIIPSAHSGTTTVKQILKRHPYLSKKDAMTILDIPLLNVIPSCPECNGLGDSKRAKVCKTDDLTTVSIVFVEIALELTATLKEKIKNIAEIKLFIFTLEEILKTRPSEEKIVEILKKLQRQFYNNFYRG